MIICGDKVRVKHGNPNILPEYYGESGIVHSRNRMLRALGAGTYEIQFFDRTLNHKILGVMGGFNEEDLEVI